MLTHQRRFFGQRLWENHARPPEATFFHHSLCDLYYRVRERVRAINECWFRVWAKKRKKSRNQKRIRKRGIRTELNAGFPVRVSNCHMPFRRNNNNNNNKPHTSGYLWDWQSLGSVSNNQFSCPVISIDPFPRVFYSGFDCTLCRSLSWNRLSFRHMSLRTSPIHSLPLRR